MLALAPAPLVRAAPADFTVTRSPSTVHPAPAGSVGRKTTDRQLWVGNTDANRNTQMTYVLTFGGFASECPPEADGSVKGDFEFSISSDATDTSPDGTVTQESRSRRLVLQLKGHVNDAAELEYVELSGSFSVNRQGTHIAPESSNQVISPRRFLPGRQGEPDMPAMEAAVRATADIAIASAMLMAGFTYRTAEAHWRKPNNCVELTFDPPTDTEMLGPNQSRDVQITLKTAPGGSPVAWTAHEIGRIDGAGTVEPRRVDKAESATVKITYTASDRPRRGHGINLTPMSRAGIADGQWKILDRYEGTFSQESTTEGGVSVLSGDIHDKLTGRLVWRPDPPAGRASSFGDTPSSFYKATEGDITVEYKSVGTNAAGPATCTTEGRHTFAIASLPPAVLEHLTLEIASDGRYRMVLVITDVVPSNYEADTTCRFPTKVVRQKTPAILPALIVGEQQGTLDSDRAIKGNMTPQSFGPRKVTGEWEFRIP